MNATSRKTPCPAALRPRKANHAGRVIAALSGLVALLLSAPAQARSISIGHEAGDSSTITGPGIRLTLSAIPDFNSSPVWKLTSFTWLSTRRSGANPTGRGHLLIFDASKFDPAGKTYAQVNSEIGGLIATSATYADGVYAFPDDVILERGKSYYFLNSAAITTDRDPKAPHQYGFAPSAAFVGVERWQADASAWSPSASSGAPNFLAAFSSAPAATPSAR